MKKFLIKVNGNQYEVEVEELGQEMGGERVVQEVRTVSAKPEPSPAAASSPAKAAPAAPKPEATANKGEVPSGAEKVTAPMPGVINSIVKNVGDTVKRGDVVLILEAMKMENEIVAPKEGKIASINVAKGASVNAGDVLFSIM